MEENKWIDNLCLREKNRHFIQDGREDRRGACNVSDLAEAGYTFYDMLFLIFQNRIAAENEVDMLRYETGEFLSTPCRRRRRRRSP